METIYTGGTILTMESPKDSPEAVLVRDAYIAAVGSLAQLKQQAPKANIRDLQGRCLMPAFVDPHSHIVMTGQMRQFADLSGCESFSDIVDTMRSYIAKNHVQPDSVAVGFGYDHNFLREKAHPDAALLDAISQNIPVLLMHISGHLGCANSAMLALAGVDETTPDPYGGKYGREAGTNRPNGYLEETAYMAVQAVMKQTVKTDRRALLKGMQQAYLENGITTCQDGATTPQNMALLREADDLDLLDVDVVVYPMAAENPEAFLQEHADCLNGYHKHIKIGGLKMILDGSPQGKTAWMSQPYEGMGDYCGYPFVSREEALHCAKTAVDSNLQLLCHCNGDAASELFLTSYEQALQESENPEKKTLRPMMVHCQTVRNDQLQRMAKLNMLASIFVGHVHYWGDIHLQNFGFARGNHISPVADALRCGLSVNFHQDTPITPPNMLHSVWCAVNRLSREGQVIGADQKIGVYEALKAATINAAYVYGEEDTKGSIKAGKYADLVILDRNPMAVQPMEIREIQVLETIKKGTSVYQSA